VSIDVGASTPAEPPAQVVAHMGELVAVPEALR
jgi:hypothetical protein